jgi:hypothetical protein
MKIRNERTTGKMKIKDSVFNSMSGDILPKVQRNEKKQTKDMEQKYDLLSLIIYFCTLKPFNGCQSV